MKFLCRLLCLAGILCIPTLKGYSQQGFTDSIKTAISNGNTGESTRAALFNRLAEFYRTAKQYDDARRYARQGAALAVSRRNYMEATRAYTALLNVLVNTHAFGNMKAVCDSATDMARRAGNPRAEAYACYARALFAKAFDSTENMVRSCLAGLKQLELEDDPHLAAKLYYQLYAVNANWNNAPKVDLYARKALENALRTDDYNTMSNCYAALATAHEYHYNGSGNQRYRDSILFYLRQAAQLYRQHPGQVAPQAYGIICINIADCYLRHFPAADNNARDTALYYARTAGELLHAMPNSEEVVASSLGILGAYAQRSGNYRGTELYLRQAYQVMLSADQPYTPTLINITQSLADFYKQQGDYPQALTFQKEVTGYNSKYFDQQQALNTQKLEAQYETTKKEQEMQVLKEREKSHTRQNYLYGSIALVSLLGLVFMFRSYHFRLRYSLQREKQLALEKQESETLIKLEREEQARLRAEQQLLELRQQQLNTEAMANMLLLDHKNKMLHQLKDRLNDDDAQDMQKVLKEEEVLDDDFEQARMQILQVHPGFFQQLSARAQKKLTLLDLKLCAYLYLKMDTRHIARMMHVEVKSVRMSRYRIKQKLGLNKDEDLNTFLQGLTEPV
ncbi:hypothetical protein [Taibaiella koreensis]|uniref:hypothetical protein n=1 Tax=Taibaiella koreensis TaxID=1268548 RepID=UPI000E59E011|nr:hypothetical protein [Taibaiella koreensis]